MGKALAKHAVQLATCKYFEIVENQETQQT